MNQELLEYLLQYVTENKKQRIDQVLSERTRHLTVALEDIYQPQNASAVVRSCDCFGLQELHVIENKNKYKLNYDVTLGSSKWVNIVRYRKRSLNNTLECIKKLKEKNYKIVATTPHKEDYIPEEIPIDHKLALFFGNEAEGLSKDVIQNADYFLRIPMVGFTESLNISVSAAICMYHLVSRLKHSDIMWSLTPEEVAEIKYKWVKGVVRKSDLLEQEYYNRLNISNANC